MCLHYKITWLSIVLLLQTFNVFANDSIINLHLATPHSFNSPKNSYMHALLTASLAAENKRVTFTYSTIPMNKKRATEELSKPNSINLVWLSIAPTSQPSLIKTSMPLYKGLHGKRLLMIHKSQLHRFENINSLDELKPLVALQKQTWSDYDVLIRNGLTVNGEHDYDVMLKLLAAGLADYFPRSVSAIKAETSKQPYKDLVIEPTIMLQYSNHYHFYSHKSNQQLINLLDNGLQKIRKSGEFERLYQQYIGGPEQGLNLPFKKVFHLK
ncbi:substrate-binding periplasmic protein [Pseudoalteromonas sp. H105]|uniref:substrate-binding periplasmic protein n=1 Tax=Pseudoalteromonas sp. H105 TaxID=1348393 RepID=UPI000731F18B|nr:transporter substrate-binding domain-containing protein [Pseudoalteromonas sp. H105]KTF16640.1 hypothetical protein ATS75_04100 [Pseudoalteromonas sp. H105]